MLKQLDSNILRKIYYERYTMIKNNSDVFSFLDSDCIYTKTQTLLMFNNDINDNYITSVNN